MGSLLIIPKSLGEIPKKSQHRWCPCWDPHDFLLLEAKALTELIREPAIFTSFLDCELTLVTRWLKGKFFSTQQANKFIIYHFCHIPIKWWFSAYFRWLRPMLKRYSLKHRKPDGQITPNPKKNDESISRWPWSWTLKVLQMGTSKIIVFLWQYFHVENQWLLLQLVPIVRKFWRFP